MIFSIDEHRGPALYDGAENRWWSYRELADAVEARSRSLPSARRELVFNFCRNGIRSVVTYLSALDRGDAVALLDDGLAPESKTRLIEIYGPRFVATGEPLTNAGYQEFSRDLWMKTDSASPPLHPDLALLLSTSGSTGSPRMVRLTRRNVEANAASICEVLAIGPPDRAITSLPMHYSYGLSVINTHLMRGASIALTDKGLMEQDFWQIFRTAECTSLAGVPYLYQILHRLDPDRLNIPTLNTLTQAGGKMSPALIGKFSDLMKRRSGRFFVMYGQTEATARIAILPSEALPEKPGSAGVPIPGGKISISDSGELMYEGPNVMMGYAANAADLALGDINQGTLATGDTAYTDSDGYIFITGRAGRDAKLFGLRVNLDEVESMLRESGPVAVISKGESLRIFCEYGDDESLSATRRDLAARLRIHQSAFSFRRIESLPLKSTGKIDYQKLADLP
jgi:long-chain acyl-CoA synthetase